MAAEAMRQWKDRCRFACTVSQAMQQAVIAGGRMSALAYYAATAGVSDALETKQEQMFEFNTMHMDGFELSTAEAPVTLRAGQAADTVAMGKVRVSFQRHAEVVAICCSVLCKHLQRQRAHMLHRGPAGLDD